jgi:hypothetical protein
VPTRYLLPVIVAAISLQVAVLGMYWDIGYHVDHGRDQGVLTVPHLFIVAGLQGFALAALLHGFLEGPGAIGETRIDALRLRLAPGGVVMLVCGSIALLGFPLDAFWHALFGEDVTLWGPTHLFMIGGASFGTLGLWMLLREGMQLGKPDKLVRRGPVRAAGGLLIGLSTFQAEFDFGVPQFQLLFQPVLLALAAGLGLVVARSLLGRWGAVKALGLFLVIRGLLALFVGELAGYTTPHFPLYIVEALVVEAAAFAAGTSRLRFAVLAGAGIGTIGFAAEWAWSHIWMPHPWPASLLPEALVLAVVAGVGGALVGARISQALTMPAGAAYDEPSVDSVSVTRPQPTLAAPWGRLPALATSAGGLLVLVALALPLPRTGGDGTVARVVPTPAGPGKVNVDVDLRPAHSTDGSQWFEVLSWQGRERGTRRIVRFTALGDGRYRTQEPVPVGGNWKTFVRLARGSHLMGVPVWMPPAPEADRPGVPVHARTMAMASETFLLQREARGGPAWMETTAYALLAAIVALWVALVAWALRAAEGGRTGGPPAAGGPVSPRWRQRSATA